MAKTRRALILDTTTDLVGSLLYYDRKEDDDLPTGSIEHALEQGEITREEIVEAFQRELLERLDGE